jgi:hypothetical protein
MRQPRQNADERRFQKVEKAAHVELARGRHRKDIGRGRSYPVWEAASKLAGL